MSDLYTPAEVSARLKVPQRTLETWRYRGIGPPFIRLGKHVRYPAGDLDRYLQEQRHANGHPQP